MFSRQNRMIAVLYMVGDALLALASYWFAYSARAQLNPHFGLLWFEPFYAWIIPLIPLMWTGAGLACGVYSDIIEEDWRFVLWAPLKVCAVCSLVLFALTFAVKAEHISRLVMIFFLTSDLTAMIIFRMLTRHFGGALREAFGSSRNFLIVGGTPEALDIAREIESNQGRGLRLAGFAVIGAIGPKATSLAEESFSHAGLAHHYPVHALSELPELLRSHVIDEVIFAVPRDALESIE